MEVRGAVHTFPGRASAAHRDMLDYIYKEQLLDLYGNLSIRLLLTLSITFASGERSFSFKADKNIPQVYN